MASSVYCGGDDGLGLYVEWFAIVTATLGPGGNPDGLLRANMITNKGKSMPICIGPTCGLDG